MLLIKNAVMAQMNGPVAFDGRRAAFIAEGDAIANNSDKNDSSDNNDQVSKANICKQNNQMDSSQCVHAQLLMELLDTIKNTKVQSDRLHNLEEAVLRPKAVGTDQ